MRFFISQMNQLKYVLIKFILFIVLNAVYNQSTEMRKLGFENLHSVFDIDQTILNIESATL